MKDALDTVNKVHLTFIAVCTAILLFGLSPDKTKTLDAAIEELKALSTLDLPDLERYMQQCIDLNFKHIDLKGSAIKFSKLSDKPDSGLKISKDINWSASRLLPRHFDFPPATGSLSDMERYFNQKNSPLVFIPDERAWSQVFNLIYWSMWSGSSGRNTILEAVYLDMPAESDNGARKVFNSSREAVFARLSVLQKTPDNVNKLDRLVRGRWVQVEGCTVENWLKQKYPDFYSSIYTATGGSIVQHSSLMNVWNDVLLHTIDGAIVALNKKKQESRGSMSLLGFSVSNPDVIIFAPLITLLVLLYLLSHLLHLRRSASKNGELPSDFPWIALYPNMPGRMLTGASLFALPVLANGLICYRAWDAALPVAWAGLLLTIMAALTGAFIIREVSHLRRTLRRASQ